ncbi:MAG: FtsH protease activity modulator HflK [Alphaproteobacteria bacterium]|nr:FtsH protease activity modulator HflK [Alphaproteobacteria bacterium]MBP7757929.1 FtsH protease activity modulator HflK [Alphaproteobacteria bacterium]MBP7761256.1 FtsH protease activity modulator HflK [Alphaproteobacteria bacterium]MBP7904827.1 FtsH protease activity modulator HflK [Alphaproteobacteria bacterium]
MSDPFGPGRKRKNPWSNDNPGGRNDGPRGPWGGGGQGGGSNEPPDLDDLIRKAQDNLRNIMPFDLGPGATVGLVVLIAAMIWMASGLYILNPGEHAVIQRFGAWNHTKTTEGLGYHMPYPIETLTKVNVTELRRMAVGFTEGMTGTGGKVDKTDESLMLTADRNIVNLQMSLQWNIKSAEDYSFNINDPDQTIKKVAESAIREVVGQTSMFPIITTERALLATKAKDILQKNLDEYKSGVNITQVLIQKAEVHPEVQNAFQDVQSAKQDAEDTENKAEAQKQDILPRARGQAIKLIQEAEAYKQSKISRAQGDAERFKSIYSAYLTGKDVTKERIFIETMEEVFKNANKTILDGGTTKSGVVPYLPLGDGMAPKAPAPMPPTPVTPN